MVSYLFSQFLSSEFFLHFGFGWNNDDIFLLEESTPHTASTLQLQWMFFWHTLHLISTTVLLVKAGSHNPIFGTNYYSNSKKLVTRINISMSWNNARKIIGSKRWIVWTKLKTILFFLYGNINCSSSVSGVKIWNYRKLASFQTGQLLMSGYCFWCACASYQSVFRLRFLGSYSMCRWKTWWVFLLEKVPLILQIDCSYNGCCYSKILFIRFTLQPRKHGLDDVDVMMMERNKRITGSMNKEKVISSCFCGPFLLYVHRSVVLVNIHIWKLTMKIQSKIVRKWSHFRKKTYVSLNATIHKYRGKKNLMQDKSSHLMRFSDFDQKLYYSITLKQ